MLQLKSVRCHDEPEEEEGEAKWRRSESRRGQKGHEEGRKAGGKKKKEIRKERRKSGTAVNEEDAFRKGLGRVCGEPVARR